MNLRHVHEQARMDAIEAVQKVHTRTIDAIAGFETMVEKAEADFRHVPEAFLALHRAHDAKLSDILLSLGGQPTESGSLMSHVNRVVVSTRAFFDEIDADVMKQIRDGEQAILEAFDETKVVVLPEGARSDLNTMRHELAEALRSYDDLA